MTRRLATLGVTAATVAAVLSGCGTTEVTAETTCGEYLGIESPNRHDEAIRLASELGATDTGGSMVGMNLDYFCSGDRTTKVGDFFDRER